MNERETFLANVAKLRTEVIRKRIDAQSWNARHRQWASELLERREAEREASELAAATEASALNRSMAEATRDAADASRLQAEAAAEANRLAREANAKAHTANIIASVAAAIAIMSAALTVFVAFVK